MLRHRCEMLELPMVDRSQEPERTIPRFRAPFEVAFRRDGDLAAVVHAINANQRVNVKAACGAGKSTVLPHLLAKELGILVVHTIPFHIAAQSLVTYLTTLPYGDSVVYVDDVNCDMPSRGVVVMSNAHFHERYLYDKFGVTTPFLLYMDEVHESDCWTSVLRTVASSLSVVAKFVCATANAGPADMMPVHLPGVKEECTYPRTQPSTWEVTDVGMPWHVDELDGNTWIFIDRATTRDRLALGYRQHGFDVRVLTARGTVEYYAETVRRLKDPNGGIVVVLADYAYRSSFTVPNVKRWICSGEVAVASVIDSEPCWLYRQAYAFETYQGLNRGGRLSGELVETYKPRGLIPTIMCDLEAVEGDAAMLLYRMHGFRPPMSLADFDYFGGPVPPDLAGALNGMSPVSLCPPADRVPWVNGHLPFEAERKQMEGYKYTIPARFKPKTVSCHTVQDVERAATPPPAVPAVYAVTTVDGAGLARHAEQRMSTPSLESVFTVETDADAYSIWNDKANPVFEKPKRVAKHLREQREQEEREQQRHKSLLALESGKPLPAVPEASASGVVGATASVLEQSGTAVVGHRLVTRAPQAEFVGSGDVYRTVSTALVADAVTRSGVDAFSFGEYYYYHGMRKAPDKSGFFVTQLAGVRGFCTRAEAVVKAEALPEPDRLYAMRLLVDHINSNTAVAVGIQRLFAELKKRPPDTFKNLVDTQEMLRTLQWMAAQCNEAQLEVRSCLPMLDVFARYPVDKVPPCLDLEQQVMSAMVDKFEACVVHKDPDEVAEYLSRLGQRRVSVVAGGRGANRSVRMLN